MKDEKPILESFQFPFTKDEMLAMGHELAQQNRAIYDLEKEKREMTAKLGADIKAANGRAEDITNRINNGYEMRDVQIIYAMDMPTEGQKTIIRTDLNSEVRVEPMTPEERQRELLFGQ